MNDLFSALEKENPAIDSIILAAQSLFSGLSSMDTPSKIETINRIRLALHQYSPFSAEPVDCIQWIASDMVVANDYNPNSVAPPEMRLLEHSITQDGYTQPIVAWRNEDKFEVIDGFHRNRVGKESKTVRQRVLGYLPITVVNDNRLDKNDRIAATIRHNRARGKHKVEAMSDIVIELKRRNWSDDRIAKELGMDADEVLRLCQITGLSELFQNQDFSEAWEVVREEKPNIGGEFISDEFSGELPDTKCRIHHTWEKWECYLAGFYEERPPNGMTQDEGEEKYREFLADSTLFEKSLLEITSTWKNSCEHYLTNERMNRIAWLGQASVAHALGIPSCCRGGYHLLTDSQKQTADLLALKYLNIWLVANGRETYATLADASSKTETELY